MAVDKQSITILAFIIIFVLTAAILSMGAIPELFRQGEKIDQSLVQQHEDAARANQTLHEDQARDIQVVKISNHMDLQLDKMQKNLTKFMTESEKRSNASIAQRAKMMDSISTVVQSLENKSEDHAKFSENMSLLQLNVSNLSKEMRDMLVRYGENSITELQQIIDVQQQILKAIDNSTLKN